MEKGMHGGKRVHGGKGVHGERELHVRKGVHGGRGVAWGKGGCIGGTMHWGWVGDMIWIHTAPQVGFSFGEQMFKTFPCLPPPLQFARGGFCTQEKLS